MPQQDLSRKPWQRYLAEFLGTFMLVFAGCGAVISDHISKGAVSHVGVALTFGFVLVVMIFALGPICAGHFNPAVTLGFAVAKRFPWKYAPAYWASQFAGAVVASFMHYLFYRAAAAEVGYGATMPAASVSSVSAVGFEIILSFLLMLVIIAVATDKRVPSSVPGLAIGLTVAVCALFGGPITGASMNPARSFGPALFAQGRALAVLPIYFIGPMIGAVIAAFCYEFMRDGQLHAQSAPGDLTDALRAEPGLSRSNAKS